MWKVNGPILVREPEINCHKSFAIDLKTRSAKCKTAKQLAEINLDENGNLLPINKVELGFGVHGSLKVNKWDIITIDETKKNQEGGTVFCCKHIEEDFWQKSFYMWIC